MLVALLAALLTGAAPAPAAHPCAAALPRGPDVPAPLILRTSCGGYRLSEDGRVTRLPRHWFAKHAGGTGRRFGADLSIRRTKPGRYLLYRGGQLVWRSSGLYPNDGGGVAFGPGLFAFATYRHGVFLTDLGSPERLVVGGHGAEAIDFTRSGRLIVSRLASLSVISPAGIVERRYRFRPSTGFAFDAASDTVMFVTPAGRLASAAGTRVRLGRTVGGFGGGIGIAGPGLLYFGAADRLTITRRDGAFVASARWRRGLATDSGVSASPDGRSVAFRLSNVYPGARSGRATVYLVHAGQRQARVIYRHRLGPTGCAMGGNLRWHGDALLYDSVDGELVLFERGAAARNLRSFAARLPHRVSGERIYANWASDYR